MFRVCLQSASGKKREFFVRATSSNKAIREAMRPMPKSEGWLPMYAFEA